MTHAVDPELSKMKKPLDCFIELLHSYARRRRLIP
jgi:hypothetical protein